MGVYDNIGDLKDVEVRRPLLPKGTAARLALTKVDLKEANGKPPLVELGFEVVTGENEGYTFVQGASLNTTKGEGKKMSGFDMSRITFKGLVNSIIPDSEKVNAFFRGCTNEREIAQRLGTLVGKQFDATLGINSQTKDGKTYERQDVQAFKPATA